MKRRGRLLVIAAGAERVAPLPVTELAQQLTRPADVLWRDAPTDQLLVIAGIIEVHVPIVDARDEAMLLKSLDVAARRTDLPGQPEADAEIADDEPVLAMTADAEPGRTCCSSS